MTTMQESEVAEWNEASAVVDRAVAEVLEPAIESACRRIAPLWPLKHFVAVNPFVGMSDLEFRVAAGVVWRTAHGAITQPADNYRHAWETGKITEVDLREAMHLIGWNGTTDSLAAGLAVASSDDDWVWTNADAVDARLGSRWAAFFADEVSRWCAAYFDEGQATWTMPGRQSGLFAAWRGIAEHDLTPEVTGLPKFRKTMRELPGSARAVIALAIERFSIPDSGVELFLHRQFMSIRGWAGYVKYLVREREMRGVTDETLVDLLAIRMAYDLALAEHFGVEREVSIRVGTPGLCSDLDALVVWQTAFDFASQRRWAQLLSDGSQRCQPSTAGQIVRPDFQAVFCIDVRSEVFRRSLEASSPGCKTIGFAGFFGFAIESIAPGEEHGPSRCPVLLVPQYSVQERATNDNRILESKAVQSILVKQLSKRLWKTCQSIGLSAFGMVEGLGVFFAAGLLKSGLRQCPECTPKAQDFDVDGCDDAGLVGCGIPFDDRVAAAEGALRSMGLTKNFARLVVLCGHGSTSTNNPFASSLDCGACGGHAGDVNARIAVRVLNQSGVRAALAGRGIQIPDDTVFVAGLHDTTTDVVEVCDAHAVPTTHAPDLAKLRKALIAAGRLARSERAGALGLSSVTPGQLANVLARRAGDWSEVRPEWGLAGNGAFIAAPRARTQHLDLAGRAFLHTYDHHDDPNGAILEMLLCAPVVVASWINLQYYASAANPQQFGSGNKALHNVIGKLGVLEGNGGDLKAGLPLQSVHDGEAVVHPPARLMVVIEAPREALDRVLEKHEGVRQLVENQWIFLNAWEDDATALYRRLPEGRWICASPTNP